MTAASSRSTGRRRSCAASANTRAELTLSEISRSTGPDDQHRPPAARGHAAERAGPSDAAIAGTPRARCIVQLVQGGAVATTLRDAARADDGRAARRDRGDRRPAQAAPAPTSGSSSTRWRATSRCAGPTPSSAYPSRCRTARPGKVLCAWLPPAHREAVLQQEDPAADADDRDGSGGAARPARRDPPAGVRDRRSPSVRPASGRWPLRSSTTTVR